MLAEKLRPPTKPEPKQYHLNQGQQAAADGFFQFLFSEERMMGISGGAGVGKTYLMSALIDRILPDYFDACAVMGIKPEFDSVEMTATTNQAAEVLAAEIQRPTSTIHSFLNLTVKDDYTTGRGRLTKTAAWTVHERKIIFIDECSNLTSDVIQLIMEGTHRCKIIFVGDHCQTAPIGETMSPIYTMGLRFYNLTEPVRNADQPALQTLCSQLRATVETGIFKPIKLVPGVIDLLDDDQMQAELAQHFAQQTRDYRVLAYTNGRVAQYTDHIRELRGLGREFTEGELLINTQALRFGRESLSTEAEVEVLELSDETEMFEIEKSRSVALEVRRATLKRTAGGILKDIMLPVDREHLHALTGFYKREKNWHSFFRLKNNIPNLRPRDATTLHKIQGATHHTVFIDAADLSTCTQPETAARILYVGSSRAKIRVCFYGKLSEKYGGFIH